VAFVDLVSVSVNLVIWETSTFVTSEIEYRMNWNIRYIHMPVSAKRTLRETMSCLKN
jgi:hypothetical protein